MHSRSTVTLAVFVVGIGAVLMILAASPAATRAAAAAAPRATPTPIYQDEFDDPNSGWPVVDEADFKMEYAAGEFHVLIKTQGASAWTINGPSRADFDTQVQARSQGAGQDKAYGLIFRARDIDNFYAFELDPPLGTYSLWKREGITWTALINWTASPAVQRGQSANWLRVVCQGPQISVYANGARLATVSDTTFATGQVAGLFAVDLADPAGASVYFDHLTVYGVGERIALNQTFLPTIMRRAEPSGVVAPAPGIGGEVTQNGQPASGVILGLHAFDNASDTIVATTTTTIGGHYLFANPPALPVGKTYIVLFGPNNTDPDRVFLWGGPGIAAFPAGGSARGGDFDIGNIALISPASDVTVTLPATFTWSTRPVSDTYVLVVFDPLGSASWSTDDLGHAGSVVLSSFDPPPTPGKLYGWYVRAFMGPNGSGSSYYYIPFRFGGQAAARPGGVTAGRGGSAAPPGPAGP